MNESARLYNTRVYFTNGSKRSLSRDVLVLAATSLRLDDTIAWAKARATNAIMGRYPLAKITEVHVWSDAGNAFIVDDNAMRTVACEIESDEINPNDAESARRDRGLPARDGTVR
jgi:hypothetical protein